MAISLTGANRSRYAQLCASDPGIDPYTRVAVSYTHLRAHETVLDLVCRLLLEKKNIDNTLHKHRTKQKMTLLPK